MKKLKISIRRSAYFILMATTTITIFSISALWVFTEITKYEQKVKEIKASYISEQRKLIKKEVKQVVSMIDFSRNSNPQKTTIQLQNEILNYYSSIRINHGGYIFINNYNGDALVFDGVKIIGKKNIKNLTDPDGIRIFDAEMNAIDNPDGGFFNYRFKKLSNTKPVPKLSYVIGYPDWEWIIGAGIYLEDLNLIIEEENNQYQSVLFKKVLYIILLFSLLLIVLFVIAMIISEFIKKEFKVFMSFLTEKPIDTSLIDYNKLRIQEFKQIARTANIVINKQRNTEELLIKERDKAHKYLNISDVIILALDKKGNVTLINKKGWETLGYNVEYIVGKNWFSSFIPLADKKLLSDNFLIAMSEGNIAALRNRESKIMTKLGEERIISWQNTMLFDDNKKIIGSLSSGTDITERRIAEESFSESEEKYKLLFDKTSDPVLIMGVDDTFIDCNNAAVKILGLKNKKELMGLHPDKISPITQPDGKLSLIKATELISKAKRDGYHRFEWQHLDKNNKLFYVDVSLTAIPILGVEYLYVVWRDISERKKQEKELIIAKNKAEEGEDIKTSFLHNMHHEIRTPLNAIMGFSQLLKDGVIATEDINSYYEDIISSGSQLSRIIDGIIDFSKLQSGFVHINRTNVELTILLSNTFKEYILNTQNKPISFSIKACSSNYNTIIITDVIRLKQIIEHLLDNAFKFTERGSILLEYTISEKEIMFSVSDTGVGIEEEYLVSIFEKFRRITHNNPERLYGGSGLGLSISKAILSQLNGKIWVESKINNGSNFYFTLPYEPLKIDYNISNKILSNSIITVVTNNENAFNNFTAALRETEVDIVHIKSGTEAIEFCQNNYKTDLMVIDKGILGMNIITTTKAIKAFKKELPIIALCNDTNNNITKENTLVAGCDDYISEHQDDDKIRMKLSLWLDINSLNEYNETITNS